MPQHRCIDPHGPYVQHEVMVEYERTGSGFRLVYVIDHLDDDILADLVEMPRDDLRRELADAGCDTSYPVPPPSSRDVGCAWISR